MNLITRILFCTLLGIGIFTPVSSQTNYDYIVRLVYNLNRENVHTHIINSYFNNMAKNISTEDIILLCNFENYTSDDYVALAEKLNKSTTELFTLDGLERVLNLTQKPFKSFYNDVLTHLNQRSTINERNALQSLGINTGDFSEAMEYGTDSEVFAVFKQGNFSSERITNASQILQTTLDNLFATVNNVILNQTKQLDRNYVIQVFRENGWDAKVIEEFTLALNLSYADVDRVPNLKNDLDHTVAAINSNVTLGVITTTNKITVNKEIYNALSNIENIIKIQAISVSNNTVIHEIVNKTESKTNFVDLTLQLNSSAYIEIAENNTAALINCSYITVSPNLTQLAVFDGNSAQRQNDKIVLTSAAEFVLGSSIVCRNRLYGLANMTNGSHIFFNQIYAVGFPDDNSTNPNHPDHPASSSSLVSASSLSYFLAVVTNLVVFVLLECF